MQSIDFLRSHIAIVEERLGYCFLDKELLYQAFVHKSFINEAYDISCKDNERLEFLGDAVLDLIVSTFLYEKLPKEDEGVLSGYRSALVDETALLTYMAKLDLSSYLVVAKGEKRSTRNQAIFADLFEAIIGAIYLDRGFETVYSFFIERFHTEITSILTMPSQNPKALLQDYAQKYFHEQPVYDLVEESGPDHEREFTIAVKIQGNPFGLGKGHSKKEASKNAAIDALDRLEEIKCP